MPIRQTLAILVGLAAVSCAPTPAPQLGGPSPVLYLTGMESYSAGGKTWVRYKYDVLNKDQYDPALFAAAPALPPCGLNANAARTWVEFYDKAANPIYGFCALGSPAELGSIWFAVADGLVPPSWVYIELNDRQTNTIYRSNLADTVM